VKRIWTSITSAVVLVAMVAVIAVTPVNFVVWSPGPTAAFLGGAGATDWLRIADEPSASPSGHILATTMQQTSQSSTVTLGTVLIDYILSNHDVLPRDAVYSPGQTVAEAIDAHRQDVQLSRDQAMAAGVRQAGIEVIERPAITAVRQNGPAYTLLLPGDFIIAIDDTLMSTANDVRQYIRNKQVGDQVVVTVLRGQQQLKITIPKLAGSSTDGTIPTLGITGGTGYSYAVDLSFGMDVDAGDVSQGLPLALATYYLLTADSDIDGLRIAAAGAVSASGDVTSVPGINEHARSAWNAHADIFIIAKDNCPDISDRYAGMAVMPVSSLLDAVTALSDHSSTGAPLPAC